MASHDEIVTDPDEGGEEPAVDRVPTRPLPSTRQMLPLLAGRIEIDLEDAEAAAAFLELIARVLREKRRLVIMVE